jgi:hypothetical protein
MGSATEKHEMDAAYLSSLPLDENAKQVVLLELERILKSPPFRNSNRCKEFLTYVVSNSLEGSSENLKERTIGVEVFHRGPHYSTGDDPVVRVNAGEVRRRLGQYYDAGPTDTIVQIAMHPGSYSPQFHWNSGAAPNQNPSAPDTNVLHQSASPTDEEPAEPPTGSTIPASESQYAATGILENSAQIRWMLFGLVASGIIIILLAAGWIYSSSQNRAMRQSMYPWKSMPSIAGLWSGFLDVNQNTDVVLEDSSFLLVQNISKQTFPFNDYLNRTYNGKLQAQQFSPEIHSALKLIAGKNLGRASEVRVVRRILALDPLASNLHFYNAGEYIPSLALQDNVILIGNPTSNPWINLFEDRLNFTESPDPNHNSSVTNHKPVAGERPTYTATDGPDTTQYCAIAYLPNPSQNGKVLIIQGTSSEAAEAGGDFLMSEEKLSSFRTLLHVSELPYFELLLKTSQVTRTPLTTTIETYRTYPDLH